MIGDIPPRPELVDESGRRTSIANGCTLGRAPSNTIPLETNEASRRHASIQFHGDHEYWLIDLASSNGTYLNERRLTQPARVFHGDTIRVGEALFRFEMPGSPPPSEQLQDATGQLTRAYIRKATCWLLVADIKNSTGLLSQHKEEQLPVIIGEWLARSNQIVESHLGMINKFLGDGFFAYWRAGPDTHEAVSACLRELKELQSNSTPEFRLVLHHGGVFIGGGASMGEDNLSGNAVNFVFRMEKKASYLGEDTVLSQAALDHLHGTIPALSIGQYNLDGMEGAHEFHRV